MNALPLLCLLSAPLGLSASLSIPPPADHEPLAACHVALEDAIEVTLVELRDFKWRPGKQPPKRIRALDGMRVRVSGFMALGTPEGVKEFNLMSDSCGCDGNTKPHHFVVVKLTDDETTFTPDELVITGELSVGEVEEDGFITSLYRIQAESIE